MKLIEEQNSRAWIPGHLLECQLFDNVHITVFTITGWKWED